MLSHALMAMMGYLAVATSRETIRPMPTITNSLVNLGKMEISFYFNGNGRDHPPRPHDQLREMNPTPSAPTSQSSHFYFPKNEPVIDEPCLCSTLSRNFKDNFLTNPSGLINKLLMNNDLFSYSKDPVSSALCCESHEHIQEGTVFFEFSPVPQNAKPLKPNPPRANPMPMMPFLFDSLIPNKSMLPPLKTKAIEIFLFPKKKEMGGFDMPKFQPKKKEGITKEGISIVGDKKLENNIDLFKPVLPNPIKKDSKPFIQSVQTIPEAQEKVEKENEKENETEKPIQEGEKMIIEPASKPNAV